MKPFTVKEIQSSLNRIVNVRVQEERKRADVLARELADARRRIAELEMELQRSQGHTREQDT